MYHSWFIWNYSNTYNNCLKLYILMKLKVEMLDCAFKIALVLLPGAIFLQLTDISHNTLKVKTPPIFLNDQLFEFFLGLIMSSDRHELQKISNHLEHFHPNSRVQIHALPLPNQLPTNVHLGNFMYLSLCHPDGRSRWCSTLWLQPVPALVVVGIWPMNQ